ncbi:ABC transporter permease [Corynebacterium glyciniphilum]|uniref:ABC transporter permease n=1 Tax=Corynebacterium glyciniphilum TaxID=1404244 RepID=UPI003DA1056D
MMVSNSIGFYGMAILSVGIGVLASLVWRVEHRNGNWNTLMASPVPTSQILLGKTTAIVLLATAMQVVFVIAVVISGKLHGLDGMLPGQYMVTSVLVVVACIPVAALQSALSAFLRSFAVPVAIALVLTGVSTMALMLHLPVLTSLPYAALTHATQIGTILSEGEATTFDAAELTPLSALGVVTLAGMSAAIIIAAAAALLNRSDTRA